MLEQVQRFMEEEHMLRPGDRVIAAVSGGADSVCLLSVLCALSPVLSFSLRVVHVHHGLRGAEADRDEAFVQRLCADFCVPFETVHCDVRSYAAAHGLSEEEAARVLRYRVLEEAAAAWDREAGFGAEPMASEKCSGEASAGDEHRPARIALAHHRDDNAETMVHHLLRGSGLRGLGGIRPVQGNRIRPLLGTGRAAIRDYLCERGLSWCEDSTNASGDYTRNRIRMELLPMMEELVNARATEHILRAGAMIAQADGYLERQAGMVWNAAGRRRGATAEIRLDAFRGQEEIIRTYLIRRMLDEAAPGWKNITARHFADLEALAFKPVGSRLSLPGRMAAWVDYEMLAIGAAPADFPAWFSGEESRERGLPALQMRVFPRKKGGEIPKNQCTKWFDYAKIKGALSLRFREKGDYLSLPGGGHKLLTRYMIDEKIPRQQRAQIPVLADGSHVLWVVGGRISEYYKISTDTETVLQVTVLPENEA